MRGFARPGLSSHCTCSLYGVVSGDSEECWFLRGCAHPLMGRNRQSCSSSQLANSHRVTKRVPVWSHLKVNCVFWHRVDTESCGFPTAACLVIGQEAWQGHSPSACSWPRVWTFLLA